MHICLGGMDVLFFGFQIKKDEDLVLFGRVFLKFVGKFLLEWFGQDGFKRNGLNKKYFEKNICKMIINRTTWNVGC